MVITARTVRSTLTRSKTRLKKTSRTALEAKLEEDQVENDVSEVLIDSLTWDQCRMLQTESPMTAIASVAVCVIEMTLVTRL